MSHIATPDKIHRRQQKAAEGLHWELLDGLLSFSNQGHDAQEIEPPGEGKGA